MQVIANSATAHNLQLHALAVHIDDLGPEVNPDCGMLLVLFANCSRNDGMNMR